MRRSTLVKIAAVGAVCFLTMTNVTVFAEEMIKNVQIIQDDDVKVYEDQYARAHVNADGETGWIDIKDTGIWDKRDGLREIAGYPLSSILQVKDGGYVSTINYVYDDGWIYDYTMTIAGKCGSDSRSNLELEITDETGDMYSLAIRSSTLKKHTVWYNSEKPAIIKIEWDSRQWTPDPSAVIG